MTSESQPYLVTEERQIILEPLLRPGSALCVGDIGTRRWFDSMMIPEGSRATCDGRALPKEAYPILYQLLVIKPRRRRLDGILRRRREAKAIFGETEETFRVPDLTGQIVSFQP